MSTPEQTPAASGSSRSVSGTPEISLYDPWRELTAPVSSSNPRLVKNCLRDEAELSPALTSALIRPDSIRLDAVQTSTVRAFLATRCSQGLQAGTGAGKTLISLWCGALALESDPERCVIITAPTNLIVSQTLHSARALFAEPNRDIISFLHRSREQRDRLHASGLAGKLILASTHQIVLDLERGVLDPKQIALMVIDEAHLNRGKEAGAQLQALARRFGIITLQTSATLTEQKEPKQAELDQSARALGVSQVKTITTGREARYGVEPWMDELNEEAAEIAERVGERFKDLTAQIEAKLPSIQLREHGEKISRALRTLARHTVPSESNRTIPLAHELQPLQDAIRLVSVDHDLRDLFGRPANLVALQDALSATYSMTILSHVHSLLTEQPRVAALEYMGRRVAEFRQGMRKDYFSTLFADGALPQWWQNLSQNTPYAILNEVVPGDRQLRPVRDWVSKRHDGDVNQYSTEQIVELFFSTKRALGYAAKELPLENHREHWSVASTIERIKEFRKKDTTQQVMVYGLNIIPTRYLALQLRENCGEQVALIMGEAGLTPNQREQNLKTIRKGNATAVCATSVGGLGLDLPNVGLLVHLNPSPSVKENRQIWGRVGRGSKHPAEIFVFSTVFHRSWIHHQAHFSRLDSFRERPSPFRGPTSQTRAEKKTASERAGGQRFMW